MPRLVTSRKDGSLDLTVSVVGQVAQDLREAAERFFMIDEEAGSHSPISNPLQGPTDVGRGVVERGLASDFGVVQEIGTEIDFGSIRATAEEIDGSAFADKVGCELPRLWMPDGFNDDVRAAPICARAQF